jgi:hypothetical protein
MLFKLMGLGYIRQRSAKRVWHIKHKMVMLAGIFFIRYGLFSWGSIFYTLKKFAGTNKCACFCFFAFLLEGRSQVQKNFDTVSFRGYNVL